MDSDLLAVFVLSLVALFNRSLLAAVTVMLLLKNPMRRMLGYPLAAYMTSITCGLVIVFTLQGSGVESVARNAIGPIQDIVLGLVVPMVAWVLRTGRDRSVRERRRAKKDAKLRRSERRGSAPSPCP